LARKGDSLALDVVEQIGRLNAIGFANITNAYDPELITVGGSIVLANKDLILKPIRRLIGRYTVNRTPEIRLTELEEDIVLYGAFVLSKRLE
jgi:glucokinase